MERSQGERLACRADLPALTTLYEDLQNEVEAVPVPAPVRLRRFLGRTLDQRRILVAETAGRIAGAFRMDGRSPEWAYWSGLVVDRMSREQGLGRALIDHAVSLSTAQGLGICYAQSQHNQIEWVPRAARQFEQRDRWMTAIVRRPERFVGQEELRRALSLLEHRWYRCSRSPVTGQHRRNWRPMGNGTT